MLRTSFAIILVAVVTLASAAPSEKQVYRKARLKLRAAKAYRADIWKLDEKGSNPQFLETVLFAPKRGYRVTGVGKLERISNHNMVWSRDKDGNHKVTKRDPETDPDYLELYVGKDRVGPTSFGTTAAIVTFDGHRCYQLNPTYGEHVNSIVVLYVDVKTNLIAGYSESFQGNWEATYSFRNLKLNPKIEPRTFLFPK